MGEIVNLRQARKRNRRAEQDAAAQENRIRHGRTRAERERVEMSGAAEARQLDGHRRSAPAPREPDR